MIGEIHEYKQKAITKGAESNIRAVRTTKELETRQHPLERNLLALEAEQSAKGSA